MFVFPFLVALALLAGSLVAASPVDNHDVAGPNGTATIRESGTPISPRRNGFSNLPPTLVQYNIREPMNQIPDYIMVSIFPTLAITTPVTPSSAISAY